VDRADVVAGDLILRHVTARSGGAGARDVVRRVGAGQHHHVGLRCLRADCLRRLDPVEHGHRDVHEDDVRAAVDDERHRLLAVRGTPDDGDPAVGRQDCLERLGEQALIVGDQDSHTIVGSHLGLRYSASTRRPHARRSTICS
jgi:hypothetical protein